MKTKSVFFFATVVLIAYIGLYFFTKNVSVFPCLKNVSVLHGTNKGFDKLCLTQTTQNVYGETGEQGNKETKKQSKEIDEQDGPDLAVEQQFELMKDPLLNDVPYERMDTVRHYLENYYSHLPMTAISGVTWTERGPNNVGGRTRAIMIDPNDATHNTVFAAGVGGGLWKSTSINTNPAGWTSVNDFFANLAITTIAYNPITTTTMYFGTGEGWFNSDAIRGNGIWKSTNGGTTWVQLAATSASANFYYVQKIVVHPVTGDVYAATRSGVFRSQNGGTSWVKVLGAGTGATVDEACDLEIDANNNIWVGMGIFSTDGLYKSASGNATTWVKKNTGGNGFPTASIRRIEIACAPSDSNYVYALVQGSGNAFFHIYKSINGGTSWTTQTNPTDADPGIGVDFTRGQCWYDLIAAVDPNVKNTLIVGGVDDHKSTDGGTTWTQLTHWYGGFGFQYMHADNHAIVYQPGSSTVVYFGNDGGVWRSTNGGTTITDRDSGYNVTQFYCCAVNPTLGSNQFMAGAQDNGTQQFSIAGMNGTVDMIGGDGMFCHIDQDQAQYQYGSYTYNNMYRSNNTGASFSSIISDATGSFVNPSDFDNTGNLMYSCTDVGKYLRWNAAHTGATTTTVTVAAFSGGKVTTVSVSPNTANKVFFGLNNGKIVRVTAANGGSSVGTDITGAGMPGGSVSCIAVEQGNDLHLLATYSAFGTNSVWETTNGGTSWTSVEGNLPDMPVRWALFNPYTSSSALLATESGVWSTTLLSGGTTSWGPTSANIANVCTHMIKLRQSDYMLFAATHGRGMFSTDYFVKPVAAFTGTPVSGCSPLSVAFTNNSTHAASYLWRFGDGTTSTSTSPSHIYNTCGSYNVKLIATNAFGYADSINMVAYVSVNCIEEHISANVTAGCMPLTVNFSSNDSVGVSTTRLWNFGDGSSTVSTQNPSHSYVTNGVFTASLITTNASGCHDTDYISITVSLSPVATFTLSDTSVCLYASNVCFTNTSSNSSINLWHFGDGINSGSTSPCHSYSTSGNKIVKLICQNGVCFDSITHTVHVHPMPVAVASNDTAICVGHSVQLTASGGTTYAWSPATYLNFTNISNPLSTPTATVTYQVIVSSSFACKDTEFVVITVHQLPLVDAGNDTAVCFGATIPMTGTGAASYVWTPNLFLSNNLIPNPISSAPANQCYILTGTDAFTCVNTDTMCIIVHPLPTVDAGNDTAVCFGNNIPLQAIGATSFQWSPSMFLTNSLISNPVCSTPISQCYIVSGTDIFSCSNTDTICITINLLPVITIGNDTAICNGNSVQLMASGGSAYQWNPSIGLSNATIANPIATPSSTTTYTAHVTTALGCTDSTMQIISVNQLPVVTTTQSADTICNGDSVLLTANGGNTYSWNPGSINGDSISVAPTVDIVYTVTVTDSNLCSSTANDTVTVLNPPAASFTFTNNNLAYTFNTTTSATSYHWDFGDGGTSTQQNPVHIYGGTATDTITLIACNGNCCDTSIQIVDVVDGITEIIMNDGLQIIPNPCAVCFVKTNAVDANFIVTDLIGQRIKCSFNKLSFGYEINFEGNDNGVFFIRNTKTGEVLKFVRTMN